MKKLLSLIVCLAVAVSVYAQDIIVKKDGTAIPAKIEKVSSTTVEYKKASNPDGPTYFVNVDELISINYQNGEKDVFNTSANAPLTAPIATTSATTHGGFITDETASRYSQDQQLLRQYSLEMYETYRKKAKTLKLTGLIAGTSLIGTGVIMLLTVDSEESDVLYWGGFALAGIGLAGGVTCYLAGNHYGKQAAKAKALIGMDHSFDNGSYLTFSVDAISAYRNPGLGIGVRYNF